MLKIRPVWKEDELKRFAELEKKYHYMSETYSGGDTLRVVIEEDGKWVAIMVCGGAHVAVATCSQKEGQTGKCEMPVGQKLLLKMYLPNALVCPDALHCQHEIVRTVARSNG